MKKLIIINLLLLVLFYTLPGQATIKNETLCTNNNQIICEDMENVSNHNLTTDTNIQEHGTEIFEVSKNGIDYIKKKEGFCPTAYQNPGEKYLTIRYGHYGADVKPGQTITEEQAQELLKADLQGYFDYVMNYCNYLNLNQNEADMLTCFAYNLGCGWIQTLTAKKTRDKAEIAEHWTAYTSKNTLYKNGLLKRRQEEVKIFLGGYTNEI